MSPDGFRSGRKASTQQAAWPADVNALVNDYLLWFAAEWHWTPAQVWDLELWQLIEFARAFDRIKAERKRRKERKR